jgi:hypothetical protein
MKSEKNVKEKTSIIEKLKVENEFDSIRKDLSSIKKNENKVGSTEIWGVGKSKLKEEIERKYEIKHLIATSYKLRKKSKTNKLIQSSHTKLKNTVTTFDVCCKKTQQKDKIYEEEKSKNESLPAEMKSDLVFNSGTFKCKTVYGRLIRSNEFSERNEGYLQHYNPLSFYDNGVETNMLQTNYANRTKLKDPNLESMMEKRNNLNFANFKEVMKLKDDLVKENINIPMKVLKNAFLAPETVSYPKYFLPSQGFGLLSNNM